MVHSLKSSLGILGIVDIVLNHTANNSEWIQAHPEAGYSTDVVPRLWPAWLVDEEISKLSREYSQGKVSWSKSAPYIKNEADLNQVTDEIKARLVKLNLHKYFVCNPQTIKDLEEVSKLEKENTLTQQ